MYIDEKVVVWKRSFVTDRDIEAFEKGDLSIEDLIDKSYDYQGEYLLDTEQNIPADKDATVEVYYEDDLIYDNAHGFYEE